MRVQKLTLLHKSFTWLKITSKDYSSSRENPTEFLEK